MFSENFIKELDLFIVTRGRTESQILIDYLPNFISKRVIIACHKGEKVEIDKNYGKRIKYSIEYEGDSIGEARDWCIYHSDKKYVLFLDDNITFNVRTQFSDFGKKVKHGLYRVCEKRFYKKNVDIHLENLFQDIYNKISTDEYGIVGISARPGNNRIEKDFVDNCRIFGCWAINKELYSLINYRFSKLEIREDFYVSLGFLINGIKIGQFYKYSFNKERGTNSKGGCSTYRTDELLEKTAEYLHKEFPEFVRIVEKDKKTWNNLGKEGKVTDVYIYWKKAYKRGLELKKKILESYNYSANPYKNL